MIIVGDKLVSEDILESEFVCNLSACKGACCVEGDLGAPLAAYELAEIDRNLEGISEVLPDENLALISEGGYHERDPDDEIVTRCLPDGRCAFVITMESGILKCGIEEAFRQGKSDFQKPISCHLYPVRVDEVGDYQALNYHRWQICSEACDMGKDRQIRVYKFVGPALIRAFGESWYRELCEIADAHLASD